MLCLAKLAEWTSTLAQVLLQIHKQTHILWIEILWEKTFEWVHSILVDDHTFEALDQGLWSFLSVDFAPAYQIISTWVIEEISTNCVHIKNSSHFWAHLDKVPDFGARLQYRFEFCMQIWQILTFFSCITVNYDTWKISSWTQHSRVGYTLHADYRLQNRYNSVGEPKKKRGASYWGERANNEEKVKKWRERWERCEIMKQIIFASQTFSREIWTKDEKEARKFWKWSFLADGTC